MKYIKQDTGEYPLTRNDVAAAAYPSVVPLELDDGQATELGYRVVHEIAPPTAGEGERAVEIAPEFVGGRWEQRWAIEPSIIEPVPVPAIIKRRQGRLALLHVSKLDAVESSIAAIEDPVQRRAAQIEYEADTWEYGNAFLQTIWQQLGGTQAELDDLFRFASTL